ncbi:hypothetical protein Z949_2926 [Sulfitobacter guttiformis KCTC 32187]|nr:hypothetical protein Z949_2926 [Sulfitobacter guttiformis KCTC 32187]
MALLSSLCYLKFALPVYRRGVFCRKARHLVPHGAHMQISGGCGRFEALKGREQMKES